MFVLFRAFLRKMPNSSHINKSSWHNSPWKFAAELQWFVLTLHNTTAYTVSRVHVYKFCHIFNNVLITTQSLIRPMSFFLMSLYIFTNSLLFGSTVTFSTGLSFKLCVTYYTVYLCFSEILFTYSVSYICASLMLIL